MARVYKYPIAGKIMLPKGAKILTVCSKADGNFLYAQVPDNEQETEPHYFLVVPTGPSFDDTGCTYIGSYIEGDFFIYHVYEVDAQKVLGGGVNGQKGDS